MQTVRCLHQKKCFSVTKMNTLPIPNELRVISKYEDKNSASLVGQWSDWLL